MICPHSRDDTSNMHVACEFELVTGSKCCLLSVVAHSRFCHPASAVSIVAAAHSSQRNVDACASRLWKQCYAIKLQHQIQCGGPCVPNGASASLSSASASIQRGFGDVGHIMWAIRSHRRGCTDVSLDPPSSSAQSVK